MISMARVDDSNLSYYKNSYFFADPHAPGVWLGSGCAHLGLGENVDPDDYLRLLEGFAPNGQALIRNAGPTEGWYGIDVPGSFPKPLTELTKSFQRSEQKLMAIDLANSHSPNKVFRPEVSP
jgi:hypothetical protein